MRVLSSFMCVLGISITLVGCGSGDAEGPPTEYDTTRLYYLPWEFGDDYGIVQGFDGGYGHEDNHLSIGEFAIDASMPQGTPIAAARGGIVEKVVDVHNFNCPDREDAPDGTECQNNLIRITHDDGSYASYLHIGLGGACVGEGEAINRGDIIAYSGHVGISAIPHLHFDVGNTLTPPTFVDVDEGGTGIPRSSIVSSPRYASANQVGRDYCTERSIPVPPLAN